MTTEPREQVLAWYRAWNAHDGDALAALLGPGGVYSTPDRDAPLSPGELPGYLAELVSQFSNLRVAPAAIAANDSGQLVVPWVRQGLNDGAVEGLPPSGRLLELHGIDTFTFRAGALVLVRALYDQAALWQQLGLDVLAQPAVPLGPLSFGAALKIEGEGGEATTWQVIRLSAASATAMGDLAAFAQQVAGAIATQPGCVDVILATTGLTATLTVGWVNRASADQAGSALDFGATPDGSRIATNWLSESA